MREFHKQAYWFWTKVWDTVPYWSWLLDLIDIPRNFHGDRGWPVDEL